MIVPGATFEPNASLIAAKVNGAFASLRMLINFTLSSVSGAYLGARGVVELLLLVAIIINFLSFVSVGYILSRRFALSPRGKF